LSVVGFQSNPPSVPALAGPRIDFEEMGRTAITLLSQPLRQPKQVELATLWSDGETIAKI
jgi:DNA-binding LacI/PurR family transcriptional regulator